MRTCPELRRRRRKKKPCSFSPGHSGDVCDYACCARAGTACKCDRAWRLEMLRETLGHPSPASSMETKCAAPPWITSFRCLEVTSKGTKKRLLLIPGRDQQIDSYRRLVPGRILIDATSQGASNRATRPAHLANIDLAAQ
jgi:hypothetical protein